MKALRCEDCDTVYQLQQAIWRSLALQCMLSICINLAHIRNSMFSGQLYGNRCGIFSQGHSAMIPCTNCCCR